MAKTRRMKAEFYPYCPLHGDRGGETLKPLQIEGWVYGACAEPAPNNIVDVMYPNKVQRGTYTSYYHVSNNCGKPLFEDKQDSDEYTQYVADTIARLIVEGAEMKSRAENDIKAKQMEIEVQALERQYAILTNEEKLIDLKQKIAEKMKEVELKKREAEKKK